MSRLGQSKFQDLLRCLNGLDLLRQGSKSPLSPLPLLRRAVITASIDTTLNECQAACQGCLLVAEKPKKKIDLINLIELGPDAHD